MPNKTKMLKSEDFSGFHLSNAVFIMLINIKMPTTVGILTFMSMINSMLSWVEHQSFIAPMPVAQIDLLLL